MRNKPAKNTSGNHSLLRQMAAQKKTKTKTHSSKNEKNTTKHKRIKTIKLEQNISIRIDLGYYHINGEIKARPNGVAGIPWKT